MKITQHRLKAGSWQPPLQASTDCHLVLLFGSTALLEEGTAQRDLRVACPEATLFGCSTAGEILGSSVTDDTAVATLIRFSRGRVRGVLQPIVTAGQCRPAGAALAKALMGDGLAHIFVLSDGLKVNGSELVLGLRDHLPSSVAVTGGLAGDGSRFARTLVALDSQVRQGVVGALGFYGSQFRIGYGSLGGWDPFGPERIVTRSLGNVLHELDGRSALGLYRRYLGEHAAGLPATGLLFPLSVRVPGQDVPLVRTLLAVDDKEQTVTFAGDVPEGARARLMHANFDRLIDGATGAARAALGDPSWPATELGLLVSCVGRKLLLKQRIEEEVEGVRDVLGPAAFTTGFYSYGEIGPFGAYERCELHNQTMTVTSLSEAP